MTIEIRQALEKQLATVVPAIATTPENTSYDPRPNTPYQRVTLLPAEPTNPTFGGSFHRETGLFQVLLCYPLRTGSGDAGAQAKLIRAAFPRGASFTAGGVTAQIERTPFIATAIIDGDRYCVPVRIRYFANVND